MRTAHVVSCGSTHFCRHAAPLLGVQALPSCPISHLFPGTDSFPLLLAHLPDPGKARDPHWGIRGAGCITHTCSLSYREPNQHRSSASYLQGPWRFHSDARGKVLTQKDFQWVPRGRHWQANTCPLAMGESFLTMEHNGERKMRLLLSHASLLSFQLLVLSFLPLTFLLWLAGAPVLCYFRMQCGKTFKLKTLAPSLFR